MPLGNATLLLHASLSLYSYNLLNMVFIGINELQCMKNDLKLSAAQIQLFVCFTTLQKWVRWDTESDGRLNPLAKVRRDRMMII